MRAFVLQDWVTIRGATTISTVVQNESQYLSLDAYQDVVFWLQVSEVTGSVTLNYETAPIKDETLFTPMAALGGVAVAMTPPKVTPILMSQFGSGSPPPLSRWVRWHLVGPAASWDISFRILVAANQIWVSGGGAGGGMAMAGGMMGPQPGNRPLGR
jgi:hypothetical protein